MTSHRDGFFRDTNQITSIQYHQYLLIYSSFYVNNNKFAIEITIKNNQIKSIFKATQYVKISFEIKLLQKEHFIPVISL